MAGMLDFDPIPQALPPAPAPDTSEKRAASAEKERRKALQASKFRGRQSHAGTRIALAKRQDKARGLGGSRNALGLETG